MQLEILLSGPMGQRAGAITALRQAGVSDGQFCQADHGFAPEHCQPDETWLAFRVDAPDADAQAHHLAKVAGVERYGWRLRLHRHYLPRTPRPSQPDPFAELAELKARLAALEQGRPYVPSIAGGAQETPGYVISAAEHSAYLFRQASQSFLSGTGVVGSGDYLVTPNGPAAMNVLVAPGTCWIPGTITAGSGFGSNAGAQSSVANTNGGSSTSTGFPTTFTSQASYFGYNDASVTLSIASANPTNPRIDEVCVTVQDAEYAGSSNQVVLQVVTGTAGATPAPPTVPQNSVVLSSVWVPAAASSIVSGDLNDLRVFARSGAGQTGHSNIATSQSTSSTTYTTLSTPDQVTGIALPTNGLIAVWYQALWQDSAAAAQAAIFLNSTQLQTQGYDGSTHGPVVQSAINDGGFALNQALFSFFGGLASSQSSSAYGADVTTGQIVGFTGTGTAVGVQFGARSASFYYTDTSGNDVIVGGPCYIFAAAGIYTVSVQFKTSSGSVTASNRKLWVQAIPFG